MKIAKSMCKYKNDPKAGLRRFREKMLRRIDDIHRYDDRKYLEKLYRIMLGEKLNLENPLTFNEKLQWLKLYDHRPEYMKMVDKYEAKKYVADIIGEEYIIPTINIWSDFCDIDFDKLPNQFVLKCTHDSGGLCICRDKTCFDYDKAKKKIQKSLKSNYFWSGREWPYKDIKPRIIAEEYKTDSIGSEELTDYKFFCFNGNVDSVMVCYDRASGNTKYYFFDTEWELKRINKRGRDAPDGFSLPRPACLSRMVDIASAISKGIPFVRVDLYQSNNMVLFGEITLYPQSGFDRNYLQETNEYFGNQIDLNLVKKEINTNNGNT